MTDVRQQIAAAAAKYGFNRLGIAGLIGNATQESSLNPNLNMNTGRGLFSWSAADGNPQASQVQLGNIDQQIGLVVKAIGKSGIRAMNNAGSPANAAVWFEQNFEKAGTPMMQNRINAANAAYQSIGGNLKGLAQQASGVTPGSPALTSQITTGGVPNVQAALRAAVQKQLWKPINTTGKVDLSSANTFLNQIVNNVDSGKFNTPVVTKTMTAPGTPGSQSQSSLPLATPTNGHVNPFPGAVGSRLDQGFDMTIKTALAPFDGKVIYASASDPGWRGGGFIAIQDAHDPSRIIYIAEGITPLVRAGQTVRAGQRVATPRANPYNGIVGNIETGWAASNGRQPLAQTASNRPQAALSFYQWIRSLGGPHASSTSNAGFP